MYVPSSTYSKTANMLRMRDWGKKGKAILIAK